LCGGSGGITGDSASGRTRAARILLVGSTARITCMGDANVGMMRIKGRKRVGICMLERGPAPLWK
jgi:hypothetical protein